jgi:hypothetical protein
MALFRGLSLVSYLVTTAFVPRTHALVANSARPVPINDNISKGEKMCKEKILSILFPFITVASTAFGILGVGDVVYDPAAVANLVRQFHQMEQEYGQLVATYQIVRNQYSQMIFMAKMVPADLRSRYRMLAIPWRNSATSNIYGTTASWTEAINSGLGVQAGYQQATERLNTYGAALSNLPADQIARVKTNYATVELSDGANLGVIDLLGRLRASAPQATGAIQNLERDTLSADPNLNTEIAVLNKINAANLITVRNGQDTNQLLVALAEQQLVDAKRKRDAEASAINEHIRFVAEEQELLRTQSGDPSARMLAYRTP